jgi:hypothetical protein
MLTTPNLFPYGNFIVQFCPTNPAEKDLMGRFAKLNVGAGKTFEFSKFSPEVQKAINDGIADAGTDMNALMKYINAGEGSSSDLFGTRAFLKGNYLYRYAGAKLGLYGNSGEEAIYLPTSWMPTTSRSTLPRTTTRCNSPNANCRRRTPSGH